MNTRIFGTVVVLFLSVSLACAEEPEAPPAGAVTAAAPTPTAMDVEEAFPEPSSPVGTYSEHVDRYWIIPEYLLWWVKDGPVPGPLVTSGSPLDLHPGALGQAGTSVLFGNSDINYKGHSGARLTVGSWLDPNQVIGLELEGFGLETHTIHFAQDSDKSGAPLIARPFFNVLVNDQRAQVITSPGKSFGGIDVFSDSRLWGAEANAVSGVYQGERTRVTALAGFRYLGLDENIRSSQSSTFLAPGPGFLGKTIPAADILSLTDRFETRNEFFGGQVGARAQVRWGPCMLDLVGKVGLGSTHQSVTQNGDTSLTGPDGVIHPTAGGLLALPSNSGLSSRNELTFMSEAGVGVGYQVTRWLSAHAGYTFLYWGDVARPGDEMNTNLNPRQIPSRLPFGGPLDPAQPFRLFNSSSYWAQGLDLGLAFSF